MGLIIGGTQSAVEDRVDLPLATKKGWPIPNERRQERNQVQLRAGAEMWETRFPGIKRRSVTGTYNCVGMVFSARRTEILPKHVRRVLDDDDFRPVPRALDVMRGDLVAYVDARGDIQHVGLVLSVTPVVNPEQHAGGLCTIEVLSKWGGDGEYIHKAEEVPEIFGTPTYYTERKLLP